MGEVVFLGVGEAFDEKNFIRGTNGNIKKSGN